MLYLVEAAWDAVGEDAVERERCLMSAERGRRWLESEEGVGRLAQVEYGGSQCIHNGFTEELVAAMKGADALLFALEPAGEQMAYAIRVGVAPAVDCGTCRVSTLSRAASRAARERTDKEDSAGRQLRQESAEAEEGAAEVAVDRQLRQESMELDWPFSSLSSLSRTLSVVSTSMIALPPPPQGRPLSRGIWQGKTRSLRTWTAAAPRARSPPGGFIRR
ncbi:hypothetical protein EV426DRAFT_662675 [Tirmania nivea]|nr:hypothetical protein EV426DRAFT_662675 [Tirmania nivea]